MKNLRQLYEDSRSELLSIGIETPNDITIKINTRAIRRYGQCRYMNGKAFEINISSRVLEDYVSDDITKGVIIHELLHSISIGSHHGGKWLRLADEVNRAYPQYNIKRTGSDSEYNLKPKEIKPKYQIQCVGCRNVINFMRMSTAVKHPECCKCTRCGGSFIRVA